MIKIHLIQSLLAKLKSPKQTASGSSAFPAVLEAAQIKEPSKQASTDKFAEPPVSKPAVFILPRHSIRHDSVQGNLKSETPQPEASMKNTAKAAAREEEAPKQKVSTDAPGGSGQNLLTPLVQVDARGTADGGAQVSIPNKHETMSSSASDVMRSDMTAKSSASVRSSGSPVPVVTSANAKRQHVIPSATVRAESGAKGVVCNEPAPKAPSMHVAGVEGARSETNPPSTIERVNSAPNRNSERSVGVLSTSVPKDTSNLQKQSTTVAHKSVLVRSVEQAETRATESPASLLSARRTNRSVKTSGQVIPDSLPNVPTHNSVKSALPSKSTAKHAPISIEHTSVRSVKESYREPNVPTMDLSKSTRQSTSLLNAKVHTELSKDANTVSSTQHATVKSVNPFSAVHSPESVKRQTADSLRTPLEAQNESKQGEPARSLLQPASVTRFERTAPVTFRDDTRVREDASRVQTLRPAVKFERSAHEIVSPVPAVNVRASQVRQSDTRVPVATRIRAEESIRVHSEPIARFSEAPRNPTQSSNQVELRQAKIAEVSLEREKEPKTTERANPSVTESRMKRAASLQAKLPIPELRADSKPARQNSAVPASVLSTSSPVKSSPSPTLQESTAVEQKTDASPTRIIPAHQQATLTKSRDAEVKTISEPQKAKEWTKRETQQEPTSPIKKIVAESPLETHIVSRTPATEQPHKTVPVERTAASAEPLPRTKARAIANDTTVKTGQSAQAATPKSEKEPAFIPSEPRVRVPEIFKEVSRQSEARTHRTEQTLQAPTPRSDTDFAPKFNEPRVRVPETVNENSRQGEAATRVEIPRDVKPLIPLQKSADGSARSVMPQTEALRPVVNAQTSHDKVVSAPQTHEAIPVVKKEPPARVAETPGEAKSEARKSEIVQDGAKHNEPIVQADERVERKAEPASLEPKNWHTARDVAKMTPSFARTSEAIKSEIIAPLIQRHDSSPRSVQPPALTLTTDWSPVKPVETSASKDFERPQGDMPRQETRNSERVSPETARPEATRNEPTPQELAKVTQSSEPIRETASFPEPELQHVTKSALPWRDIQARVEQALEQSRKRIVEPDHLNLSFFTDELGTFEIDIVREREKLSIRVGGESKVVTMMEEEKIQLVQWMREQGYQVERVEFSTKSETASAFHRESPQQNQERPEQLARGSARLAGLSSGGEAEANASEDAIRPQVFGQRVWTA